MIHPPLRILAQEGSTHTHTHTAIFLHGRGSNGPEFADKFFSSTTSQNKTLRASLPSWRWVFPTSLKRYNTAFQKTIPVWFDAFSLTDIEERQDLQLEGLRESVFYILTVLEDETKLLDGKTNNVYLGGMSQGMATSLWTFFYAAASGRVQGPLGGILGFCGWLPFARKVNIATGASDRGNWDQAKRSVCGWFLNNIEGERDGDGGTRTGSIGALETPVLLAHGIDDQWVSVELGRQAARILKRVGLQVELKEFSGAEGDGHWIKEPEGFDLILGFIERRCAGVDGYNDI